MTEIKKRETLTANLEDYLETIFHLENRQKGARAKDIADSLGVQRATVTGAMQSLSQKGFVHYHPYSSVTLTPEGFRLASRIVYRHKVLQEFFAQFLQLPEDVAASNACRLEHHIDDQALERLIAFIQFVKKCPRTGPDWLKAFTRLCDEHGCCANCEPCIADNLKDYRLEQE